LRMAMEPDERVGHIILSKKAALSLDSQWEWDIAQMMSAEKN